MIPFSAELLQLRRATRALVSRTLEQAAAVVADEPFVSPGTMADAPFLPCSPLDEARWNREWLRYLATEHVTKLTPASAYTSTPPLPRDPFALIEHRLGDSPPLGIFAHAHDIEGKRIFELGAGCGNLGKLIARYAAFYLGSDYSSLALMIARLVSPANTAYVHLADREGLRCHFGTIDTAIGRYFWIHQNFELARRILGFLAAMLRSGGRVYADFFWPAPSGARGVKRVCSPDASLSTRYPSSVFAYNRADVERLVRDTPFLILEEHEHAKMQRRYVVLERR